MGREPGLSVRLKLTLSYAGFLMVAGFLLIAVVLVFLLRYVPDEAVTVAASGAPGGPGSSSPAGPTSGGPSPPRRPWRWRSCWCSGWPAGGSSPAGCSPPSSASPRPAGWPGAGRSRTGSQLPGRSDEFRELADAFDAMLARLEAHVAEQQRFAANASHELRTPLATTQALLDVARQDPSHDPAELVERLHAVNARAIDLTEALLLLSRADRRSFARERVDLSLLAEDAAETLLPFAEKRGVSLETSGDITPAVGSRALLLQMTTNLVHNAIVHNLPDRRVRAGADRGPAGVGRAHRREHRRAARPTAGRDAHRAVPARHRTRARRRRGRRPRPGDRREHRPRARRAPRAHRPGPTGASGSWSACPPHRPGPTGT